MGKKVHNDYCNYEIKKAGNMRVVTVRDTEQRITGLKTSGLSKAMLARQLYLAMI